VAHRPTGALAEPVDIVRRHSLSLEPRTAAALPPRLGRATFSALFHGIDGAPRSASADDWARDAHEIVHHRLAGLALAAAEADGVELDPATREHLVHQRETDMVRSLAAEAMAPAALRALGEAGIPGVVTKGPGIARMYALPSLRPFRDIDILVDPSRFEAARRILGELGFRQLPDREGPRSYFPIRCREAMNLFRDDGTAIDLHHHVPPWVWGRRLPFARIHRRAERLDVAGGTVAVADRVHNLIVAALHLISDGGRPGQTPLIWRDLVEMAAACDPAAAEREARAVGLDWCLAFVLRNLPEFARPHQLLEHLGHVRPSRLDAFRLRHLLPPALGSRHLVGQAFCLPTANAAAFMAGYLVPSRAFLQRRYGSAWAYGRWWRDAFGRFREAHPIP
jgi:hypothetical protein